MTSLSIIPRYIQYILHAIDEHSLQAPFVYDFYTHAVKGSVVKNETVPAIEALRGKLLRSNNHLYVEDLGAGSRVSNRPQRKVSEIAKGSLSTKKFSAFLYRLIRYYDLQHIVELGTSFGINTLYMASAGSHCRVTTFEGCRQTAMMAKQHFTTFGKRNIRLLEGNISDTLPGYLSEKHPVDLVYFDANHQYEPTLQYFNSFLANIKPETVFIFDDIHWSSGMERVWKEIRQHPRVTLSVDLFDAGIVFFRKGLRKSHYVLEF